MRSIVIAAALAIASTAAQAHEIAKGPNGGPVVDSAGHHVEMVSSGTDLTLFLTDATDKPLSAEGSKSARAIVQDGGKTSTVPLSAAAPNKLIGSLPQPLGAGARVVVSATMADGHVVQARFVRD
jgi:methionine-rich copper-binding protein CopC